MVIFTKCPECGVPTTANIHQDIQLVEPKAKFEQNIDCLNCKTNYQIVIKLKARTKKDKKDIDEKIAEHYGR
jgi:hypothetical protein